jgi:hypothetical protein
MQLDVAPSNAMLRADEITIKGKGIIGWWTKRDEMR